MANPLTLKERLAVVGLINHDLMDKVETPYANAVGPIKLSDEALHHVTRHIKHILTTITILSTYDTDCYFEKAKPLDFRLIGDELLTIHGGRNGRLAFSNEFQESLMTHKNIIYAMLHNLAKNALRFNKDGLVDINITPFFGGIRNPVYLPLESRLSGGFAKFSVHDDGPGFPTDMPLKDFLENGVSTRGEGHGFGLYFVKLAAKFLRAPIAIESKPGDTTVSLYHLVNLG